MVTMSVVSGTTSGEPSVRKEKKKTKAGRNGRCRSIVKYGWYSEERGDQIPSLSSHLIILKGGPNRRVPQGGAT